MMLLIGRLTDCNARMSRWEPRNAQMHNVFSNQALNTTNAAAETGIRTASRRTKSTRASGDSNQSTDPARCAAVHSRGRAVRKESLGERPNAFQTHTFKQSKAEATRTIRSDAEGGHPGFPRLATQTAPSIATSRPDPNTVNPAPDRIPVMPGSQAPRQSHQTQIATASARIR